jgi:hypothetical protein
MPQFSRRELIVGAAAASAVAAPGAAEAAVHRVGLAPEARQAIGVIGTILQDGLDLVGFGYLTEVAGLHEQDLFTDPSRRGAATARLRWHAHVRVGAIDVLPSLFYGTAKGRLRIFFARDGGAQDGQPDTFASGRLVARYAAQLRNIQTVYAPDHAVTEIFGELAQREAHRFVVRGRHCRLGRVGLLEALYAAGPAVRTERTIPRSTRYVAGGISIPR